MAIAVTFVRLAGAETAKTSLALGDLRRAANGLQISEIMLLQLAEERTADGVLGSLDLDVSWMEFHVWTILGLRGFPRQYSE